MAGIKFGSPAFGVGKPEGGIKFPLTQGVRADPGAALVAWDDDAGNQVLVQWDDNNGNPQYLEWDV